MLHLGSPRGCRRFASARAEIIRGAATSALTARMLIFFARRSRRECRRLAGAPQRKRQNGQNAHQRTTRQSNVTLNAVCRVVQILHVSDPHAQTETMKLLNSLAMSRRDCDVVALTGDCVSTTCRQLPEEWNHWPQAFKLSVPGNHGDDSETFRLLDKLEVPDTVAMSGRRPDIRGGRF